MDRLRHIRASKETTSLRTDFVLWAKNAGRDFRTVLYQFDRVVPAEYIGRKLLVDDYSTDSTRQIAKQHGWTIIPNEGSGISDGANTALKYVEMEQFVSLEQDVVLAKDWWRNIPKLLKGKTVVASGVRLPNRPKALHILQRLVTERYRAQKGFTLYGKTLDNTIYKTEAIRELGGFPCPYIGAGVDTVLAKMVDNAGYSWKVDFDTRSTHLRTGLWDELRHYFWYGRCHRKLMCELGEHAPSFLHVLGVTGFSPIRGIQLAIQGKAWQIAYIYPLIRLCGFAGILRGYLP